MRRRTAGWLGPAGAIVVLALIAATIVLGWQRLEPPGVPAAPASPLAADRAIAVGILLDSPRPSAVIDRAIEIADALRQRYGIDSGDVVADREQAARRAQQEVVESLEVSEQALSQAAAQLGYSLDPAACGGTCENVRRLARLELQRRALERFADGAGPAAEAPLAPAP